MLHHANNASFVVTETISDGAALHTAIRNHRHMFEFNVKTCAF